MDKQLYTMKETAEILGVSLNTLRRWDNEGTLKAFRLKPTSPRRYKIEVINKFLNK